MEWSNPHVFLHAEATGDGGRVTTYLIETQATGFLRRAGISKNSFTIGEMVTIRAWRAKHDKDLFSLHDIVFADGRKIEVSPDFAAKRIFQ